MSYEQFVTYVAARSATLAASPSAELNQLLMAEEDDAFDWKVARDMLTNMLSLTSNGEL